MLKMYDFCCASGHKFEALVEKDEMPFCPVCNTPATERCWSSPKYMEDIIMYINNKMGRKCSLQDVPSKQKWV